jgi:hypothetical protein
LRSGDETVASPQAQSSIRVVFLGAPSRGELNV